MFDFNPFLADNRVVIRPLCSGDFDALYGISSDPLLWEQHPAKERSTYEGFKKWFEEAMATEKALFIEDRKTGQAVGTSRYREIPEDPRAIEIGWTFIAREFWGRGYNGAIKKLMIDHAFTRYDKIFFFVDKQNYRSQKAVEKLGGKIFSPPENSASAERATRSFIYCIYKEAWSSL